MVHPPPRSDRARARWFDWGFKPCHRRPGSARHPAVRAPHPGRWL